MQLFFYFCFIYLFKSAQANWSCDEIITPITIHNPYKIVKDPQPCQNSTAQELWVSCKTTTLEPFFFKFGNAQQNTRLGCYIQANETEIVGTVGIETLTKQTPSLLCPLRKSIIKLVFNATEMRLKFDIKSNIALYCDTIEDDPKVFYTPSKEVASSEKGKGPENHCDCGKRKKILSNRIINGTYVTKIEVYPWMVSIRKINSIGYFNHHCGGSIITRRHVITAAHCVKECDRNCGGTYGVKMETDRTDSINGTIIPVGNVFRHEEYNSTTNHNDIAILELTINKIPENQYMPICIPKTLLPNENDQLTVLGWGAMGIPDKGKEEEQLKKTHMRLIDPSVCEKIIRFSKDSQICTFSKHSSTAGGDSGGPWMYVDPKSNRYNLVGITSYGTYLYDLFPSAHTAVHHYYDWIIEKIKWGISVDDDKCNISL